jgi:hypothetical protein
MHPMLLLGDEPQVEVRLETICAERTIGLKIVLDAPDETPR